MLRPNWHRGVKGIHKMMGVGMASQEEIREENRKIRRMRLLVDLTCSLLAQADLSYIEMLNLVEATRRTILEMFPGKEQAYDLIYRPRFERIIRERLNSN